jgi:uncharacterized paraquat-inducible protein A
MSGALLPPKSRLIACAECDLLLPEVPVPEGSESLCPRCGHGLQEGRPDSVLHAVILSVIGLILLVPAMGMPLLSLSSTGLRHDVSLTHAILALGNNGYWEVATLVAVCALVAPFLNLWLVFTVSTVLQERSTGVAAASVAHQPPRARVGHAGSIFDGGAGIGGEIERHGAVATGRRFVLFYLLDAVYIVD